MGPTRTRAAPLVCLVVACAALGLPAVAPAAEVSVTIRDNAFAPQELHIDPGDTVVWTHVGTRVHDVTSDTGEFLSGDMARGDQFSHRFREEGFYYYHCSFHGRAGRHGMWGVVVVGDPPPPGTGEDGERTKIVVPGDFKTIQGAVDAALPGSTIVIRPGVYDGNVTISTGDLIVKGVDRFRTILHGRDRRANGFVVDGAADVTIANLTVRNFTGSGISFVDATGYTAARVDAIKNRAYGVHAARSYDGVVRNSFGWGSGAAAFHVGECMGCGALLDHLHAEKSYLGYSGTNATGVTIRNSTWVGNGTGIAPNTVGTAELAPGRGTLIVDNLVRANNYGGVPEPGAAETFGIPIGTGIWLAGVESNVVRDNSIADHERYGVLVTQTGDGFVPEGNTVVHNTIARALTYALAWDGAGSDNCFSRNDLSGETGPPEIETLYGCDDRPFAGAPYSPVQEDVAHALAESETRETAEPPEPRRPRCQKGRPGCHRH
jgi:plastocyanin